METNKQILVPAYSAILGAGLHVLHPVVWDEDEEDLDNSGPEMMPATVCDVLYHIQGQAFEVIVYGEIGPKFADVGSCTRTPKQLRLDLSVPSVRDACTRAIRYKLRPDEPAALTAPRFRFHGALGCWLLGDDEGREGMEGSTRAITFARPGLTDVDVGVAGLTDELWHACRKGSEGAILHALAAVLAGVLT